MDDAEEVCRTCLKMLNGGDPFVSINLCDLGDTVTLKIKLKSCVPEMVLPEEEQASMCGACVKQLNIAYSFRSLCLRTEETLNNLDSLSHSDMIRLRRNKKLSMKNGLKNTSVEVLIKDDDFNKSVESLEKANKARLKLNAKEITVTNPINNLNSNGVDVGENLNRTIITECNEVVETIVEVNENNRLDDSCIVIDDDDVGMSQSSTDEKFEFTDDDLIMKACMTIPELHTFRPEMLDCRVSLEYYTEEELLDMYNKPDEEPPSKEDELQVITKVEEHIDLSYLLMDGRKRPRPRKKWSKKDLTCKYCNREFTKRDKLVGHVRRTHTKEKPFVCRLCNAMFYENWILLQHIRKRHNPANPTAQRSYNAQPTFQQQTNMRLQQRTVPMGESQKGIRSTSLPSKTPTLNNIANRMRPPQKIKIKPEPPEKIKIKTEPTFTNSKEKANAPTTSNTNEHKCKICKKVFINAVHLQKHSIEHKMIRCKDCLDMFNSHSAFMAHVRKCMKEFACPTCNKTFGTLRAKNLHAKVHGPRKFPYFCKECNTPVQTKDHFNIHTGAKPYKCNICGATFSSASAVNGHTQMHRRNRYKKCPHCHKSFIQKMHLENHLLQYHKKEMPAKAPTPAPAAPVTTKCNVCNKSFKNKADLSSHSCANAKGEPIYTCEVCKNNFVGRAALIEHVKIHVGKM